MNRSDFVKSLGLGAGGIVLPDNLLLAPRQIKIYDNYIKGVIHYDYKHIAKTLKEGDILHLKREAENEHDSFAIEIYHKEKKLGYVRAFENVVLANMLDNNVELNAYVSKHQLGDEPFTCIAIAIYANLIAPSEKLISILKTTSQSDDAEDIYRQGPF
ncbi:MAG: HIRAN domain-containing protein [Flavobacteriaceae bacterium]